MNLPFYLKQKGMIFVKQIRFKNISTMNAMLARKVYYVFLLVSVFSIYACKAKKVADSVLISSVVSKGDSLPKPIKITATQYIDAYKSFAIEAMSKYRIPASITLAQGLLESANGNSTLARLANNHFGIKCPGGWTGESIFMDDDAQNECFRSYKSADESFYDHSAFLTRNKRYAFLFQYQVNDYVAWANGLKQAGYATNPQYPDLLISLINRYKLYEFDENGKRISVEDPFFSDEELEAIINMILPMPQNYAEAFYKVRLGDTLFGIAKKFNLSVEQLQTLNSLSSNSLKVGQTLRVSQ